MTNRCREAEKLELPSFMLALLPALSANAVRTEILPVRLVLLLLAVLLETTYGPHLGDPAEIVNALEPLEEVEIELAQLESRRFQTWTSSLNQGLCCSFIVG